jgi:hypothetical protein
MDHRVRAAVQIQKRLKRFESDHVLAEEFCRWINCQERIAETYIAPGLGDDWKECFGRVAFATAI